VQALRFLFVMSLRIGGWHGRFPLKVGRAARGAALPSRRRKRKSSRDRAVKRASCARCGAKGLKQRCASGSGRLERAPPDLPRIIEQSIARASASLARPPPTGDRRPRCPSRAICPRHRENRRARPGTAQASDGTRGAMSTALSPP
jgi:hypothetical protein